ncbi:uncharacterized protein LOC143028379 isoform X1 [Oratosquilla oratoria]|uniref:uncharacterized protein LOC143028379 isoform X1 n=2 Tax=Oratosquilla oratoria TaxID=337810 RepID=UPI003F769927
MVPLLLPLAWILTVVTQTTLVMADDLLPPITPAVRDECPSILRLWECSERRNEIRAQSEAPKTIIAGDHFRVMNLVPQDSPHPLYDDSEENTALRRKFLLDHMFSEKMDPQDQSWTTKEMMTLAGTPVTFQRGSNGDLTVAGIRVTSSKVLSDGTALYELEAVPFGYTEKVHEAWKKLLATRKPVTNFMGGPPMPPPRKFPKET